MIWLPYTLGHFVPISRDGRKWLVDLEKNSRVLK
jgi:hypothetical protein